VLGQEVELAAEDAKDFCALLRSYIQAHPGTNMWPIIQSTRVFVNAAVLSRGTILVDFPGSNDTNEARNRVAKEQMAECDHIFIVTPARRAITNKVTSGEWSA
jgi:hypothetical protein